MAVGLVIKEYGKYIKRLVLRDIFLPPSSSAFYVGFSFFAATKVEICVAT
jgi:hypothetical protein